MDRNFEDSIAYAAKNRTKIKAREVLDFVIRGGVKTARLFRSTSRSVQAVGMYPSFDTVEPAADIYNRIAWYLGGIDVDVHMSAPAEGEKIRETASQLDYQPLYNPDAATLHVHSGADAASFLEASDAVLVWRRAALFSRVLFPHLHKTYLVDAEHYFQRETASYSMLLRRAEQPLTAANVEQFAALERDFQDCKDGYVFATGPSLDMILKVDVPDDAVKVVCNSIVRSDTLLDHISPDILTFADPVFHFGPSRYAAQFREDAVETIRRYGCWCVVPPHGAVLLRTHYPDIAERVIGVPASSSDFVFPSSDNLRVHGTANIMTHFMLPVVSSLSDRITVVGADGRKESDSYFWEHSSIAQYEGLMLSAAETHPAFFRDRIYAEYYEKHIEILRAIIEYGEQQGRVYQSITPSYIPALRERLHPECLANE
jgi:hypothetical protein